MKISTIFILNLPKYDPFGDVRDDVPEAPGNLDHLIHFVARTLNYLSFKFHNDMTNTLATIYCHRSLPPKSNFWRFKTTVGGGQIFHLIPIDFKSSSTKNRLIIDLIFLSTTSIDLPLIGHVSNCTSDKNI